MNLLHVITTIERGGAENHLVDLIERQVSVGDRVTVAYLKYAGYWRARLEAAGVRVVDLGMRYYGDPRPLLRLRRLLYALKSDVVHAHMPPAELYARLALLGDSRTSFVISKHNDERFFRGWGSSFVATWTASRAGKVIAISSAVKRYMVEQRVQVPDRLVAIHYGIDSTPYQAVAEAEVRALRNSWGLASGTCLIGTVARLVPQKALHILLEGFALFLQSGQVPARLVLVGRGPLEDALKSHAEALGIADKVLWTGFREDIPAVMRALDVFALTSEYEGFGLVLLEAMAAGTPVVATRVSAIPEVVSDDESGLLIDSGSPLDLAKAFLKLENPAERLRLGQGGVYRVETSFSPEKMRERISGVYAEVGRTDARFWRES